MLIKLAGPTQPTSYNFEKADFMTLLDALKNSPNASDAVKMYFAIFDAAHPGSVPAGSVADKQLVILFTPATLFGLVDNWAYATAQGKIHYLLIPGQKLIEIDTTVSNNWIKFYDRKICTGPGGFSSTINHDRENWYNGKLSDTKSMFYPVKNFDELFVTEIQNQETNHGNPVSQVQMNLACYTNTGDDEGKNKNRVLIQFNLLTKNAATGTQDVINLEAQPDFEARAGARSALTKMQHPAIKKNELPFFDFDNGQLCPLNCPPADGSTQSLRSPAGTAKKPVHKKQY